MEILSKLRSFLGVQQPLTSEQRAQLMSAWGIYEEPAGSLEETSDYPPTQAPTADYPPTREAAGRPGLEYDRSQWRKKLRRMLDELPASSDSWSDLAADVEPLGLGAEWVRQCEAEEFRMLVRRMVADGQVTSTEQRRLTAARELLSLDDLAADAIVEEVITDAEAFFGKAVERAR